MFRPLRDLIRPHKTFRRDSPYRGHFAVTRSLIEGLCKIGVDANYNPKRLSEIGHAVVVLSGIGALRQAILWKREGRIARLLAGPNILVFPSEYPDVIAAPEVDCCITPSNWVCSMYESDCPALSGRCIAWPAGVDTEYWQPRNHVRESRRALIFDKTLHGPIGSISPYVEVLERKGYDVAKVAYGSYTREEYLDNLQRSSLMIGFAASESQGIAWAEAWSSDVPTLLWSQDHNTILDRTVPSSTAPYLTEKTGLFFAAVAEFEQALDRWETTKGAFGPRQWVLENMSDEACARQLCHLAGISTP